MTIFQVKASVRVNIATANNMNIITPVCKCKHTFPIYIILKSSIQSFELLLKK